MKKTYETTVDIKKMKNDMQSVASLYKYVASRFDVIKKNVESTVANCEVITANLKALTANEGFLTPGIKSSTEDFAELTAILKSVTEECEVLTGNLKSAASHYESALAGMAIVDNSVEYKSIKNLTLTED